MPAMRSMAVVVSTLTALSGIVLTRQTAAQTLELPRKRQGYYLGGGLDFGATRFVDDGKRLGVWFTQASAVHFGQMLTEHLGLGLAINLGAASKRSDAASLVGLAAEGQWELLPNFALHGGFGFGVVSIVDTKDSDEPMRGSYGGQYLLAASYDWFPGNPKGSGGFSIEPIATVRLLPNDPLTALTFTLGVRFNWWKGLPKNELSLPPGEGYSK